ncbi:TIGR02996 domain-containing protein [Fimbriiglobus ruber]|uniref:TIGR02996 domain-containing protein n=1 Tax=Fimbriiglobus ruber TaxID=1908690 RepID=UPI001379F222|nr:TIGR02996 domain-containing protein [Fimbriiglobus ruber]
MTDREALYRAVLAAPDDDLPRLVLADWFEENGRVDRAVYIRAQVELARLVGENNFDEDYLSATVEVSAVLPESIWQWAQADGLPTEVNSPLVVVRNLVADLDQVRDVDPDITYGFRRGFVEYVRCSSLWWIEIGPTMVSRAPLKMVELNWKQPRQVTRGRWEWRTDGGGEGPFSNWLPRDIFIRLPQTEGAVSIYRSRRAAVDALSEVCLAMAQGERPQ